MYFTLARVADPCARRRVFLRCLGAQKARRFCSKCRAGMGNYCVWPSGTTMRARLIAAFADYLRVRAEALPALATRLYNHALIESMAPAR